MTQELTLTIKGGRKEAEAAARQRGVRFDYQRPMGNGATVGLTPASQRERVTAWHREAKSTLLAFTPVLAHYEIELEHANPRNPNRITQVPARDKKDAIKVAALMYHSSGWRVISARLINNNDADDTTQKTRTKI